MVYEDDTRGFHCVEDPEVVRFRDRWFLYYTLAPGQGSRRLPWHIGIAVSDDLERWQKLGELTPHDLGTANGIAPGCLIVIDGRLHLFYFNYGSGPNDSVCLATSDDGLRFTPHPRNPIFRALGEWNCGRAISPSVIQVGDRLRMYACTRDPDMSRQSIVVAEAKLNGDLGPGTWTQLGWGEAFGPEEGWEHESTESPAVIERGGAFYMFYGGGYWTRPQQVGCARSADGVRWARLGGPLLPYRTGVDGAPLERASPSVFRDLAGDYHLVVQESSDRGRNWRLVSFPIDWQGDAPVLRQ